MVNTEYKNVAQINAIKEAVSSTLERTAEVAASFPIEIKSVHVYTGSYTLEKIDGGRTVRHVNAVVTLSAKVNSIVEY